MRDGVNPRTGMAVAVCSPFLFFGFMFTVSGLKGERLGAVPLVAIGPVVCLPGVAAIFLASRTDGCRRFPPPPRCCCSPKRGGKPRAKMASGGELRGDSQERGDGGGESRGWRGAEVGDSAPSATPTVDRGEGGRLLGRDQEEALWYLQARYASVAMASVRDGGVSDYSDRKAYALDWVGDYSNSKVGSGPQRDSWVVFYGRDVSPSYYCYLDQRDFWDIETVV